LNLRRKYSIEISKTKPDVETQLIELEMKLGRKVNESTKPIIPNINAITRTNQSPILECETNPFFIMVIGIVGI
jgi:hypothetical protein